MTFSSLRFNKKATIISLILILLVLLLAIFQIHSLIADPEMEYAPNNIYNETIIVATDPTYPPFSFVNQDGVISGSEIELIYAIADQMQVNVDIVLMPRKESINAVLNGEVDLVLGVEYIDYYRERLALSYPVELNQLVLFGKKPIDHLQTLYNHRTGAIDCNATKALFTLPMALEDRITLFDTYQEGFNAILNGEIDYFLGKYSVGNRVISQEKIKGVKAVGTVIANNAVCIGGNLENVELHLRLNNAIVSLSDQGIIGEISDKWLGNFVQIISFNSFVETYSIAIILIIIAVAIGLIAITIKQMLKWRFKAETDLATGIYNKRTIEHLIGNALATKPASGGSLFLVDLDNFKTINDQHGHLVGDQCIINVAEALKDVFRETDLIGRIGGDEFIVYTRGITSHAVISSKTFMLNQILNQTHTTSTNTNAPPIHVSIGVATVKKNTSFEKLYVCADKALYKAKNGGKSKAVIENF